LRSIRIKEFGAIGTAGDIRLDALAIPPLGTTCIEKLTEELETLDTISCLTATVRPTPETV
jgi:hypothetical protein